MTVEKLIKMLEEMPKDSIVVLTEPNGVGWDNIGKVVQEGSIVKVTMDGKPLFEN